MKSAKARAFAPSCAVLAAAICFALAAASPAAAFSFGKKKAPPPPEAPPPESELTVGPPVLASYVIDAAGAYATYMQTASAIGARFNDGPAVASALRLGVRSEQHQLQQGVVAYAAVLALQDPNFTAALRDYAKHASTRDSITRYILSDPNYVMTISGHDSAAGLIVATMNAQASRLTSAGEAVRRASYSIQLQSPWSKKPVPNPAGRLEEVKQLATSAIVADPAVKAQLIQASTGAAPMAPPAGAVQPPYSQAVVRGMAIAALAMLGKASDQDIGYLMPLLVNDGDGFCFNMAKLNLYQCLSVARPYYEDVYCLGLHAMGDTGRCVTTSIGSPEPVTPLPTTMITSAGAAGAASNANSAVPREPIGQ